MGPERRCPKCGQVIPWGQTQCPRCSGRDKYFWSMRRDTFLLMIFMVLIPLFVITGFAVKVYHTVERGYAQDWYDRGQRDLRAGRTETAQSDFRTALTYSHDNDRYQLRLTEALMAGRAPEASIEARTYLLNLLEREPGNGTVNLEMARLAARQHAVSDALRYYHGTIYGEWDDNPVARRRAVRLELVEFLLGSGQKVSAHAELIDLAADLPPDPAPQTKVGNMLLQVGGHSDALKLFRAALVEDPHFTPALAGAGECYFQNHDFRQAVRYLSAAVQQDPYMIQAASHLCTAQAILEHDPFDRRLSNRERARRAALDFDRAVARVQSCAGQKGIALSAGGGDSLSALYAKSQALQPRAQLKDLSHDPELLSQLMDTVFEIEQATARACGEPHGVDLSLLLMAQAQGESRP